MERETLYRCLGSCAGIAQAPQSCEDASCDRFGDPLTAVMQCESCAAVAEKDGGLHACDGCEAHCG